MMSEISIFFVSEVTWVLQFFNFLSVNLFMFLMKDHRRTGIKT